MNKTLSKIIYLIMVFSGIGLLFLSTYSGYELDQIVALLILILAEVSLRGEEKV